MEPLILFCYIGDKADKKEQHSDLVQKPPTNAPNYSNIPEGPQP